MGPLRCDPHRRVSTNPHLSSQVGSKPTLPFVMTMMGSKGPVSQQGTKAGLSSPWLGLWSLSSLPRLYDPLLSFSQGSFLCT